MPELPEVETIARQLAPHLIGRKLKKLTISDPKLRVFGPGELVGRKVVQVKRSGKEVLIEFSGGRWLLIHLRMTGRLLWHLRGKTIDSHDNLLLPDQTVPSKKSLRARFEFDRGELLFADVRRFGTFKLLLSEPAHPGLDPLSPDFTSAALKQMLQKSSQRIKIWLLRQDEIVGIGNIYASEILFRSRIHPHRPANDLNPSEIKKLHSAALWVLNKAIQSSGTTFSDYRDSTGESGSYQSFLKVYNRQSHPCPRCPGTITREVQAQRSTFYCPLCQK